MTPADRFAAISSLAHYRCLAAEAARQGLLVLAVRYADHADTLLALLDDPGPPIKPPPFSAEAEAAHLARHAHFPDATGTREAIARIAAQVRA